MPYSGEPPTLSLVICQPMFDLFIIKPTFGKPYIRGLDLRMFETQLYAIGAAIGHGLPNKLDILGVLLTTPDSTEQERNSIMDSCKKYAELNLKEFINEFGQEPNTFVDFMLSKGLKKALGLSPQEAFKAFLSRDGKVKKLFGTKVDTETIGHSLIMMLFQGVQFGSSFPELTERMYDYHHKHYKDYWGSTFAHGAAMPEELKAKSLAETEKTCLNVVESYAAMYYPELLDPLGFIDPFFQTRIKEVISVMEQHKAELEDFMNSTSPDEFANLMIKFLEELRLNWPREYSQLNPERRPASISKSVNNNIELSYSTGYMVGKGWISQEHLADFGIYLGDKLASDLRLTFNGIKSNGNAFAGGYAIISSFGTVKGLQNKGEKTSRTEVPTRLEVNLTTQETLGETKIEIAPKTPSDITRTTIPPWERESDATDEITRAIELVTKKAHTPDIDGKELTLLVALQQQLINFLTAEQMMGELIVEMKLSLLKGESLGEISQENIPKEREHVDKQKAKFQKMVEEDKEKVRKILKDLGLT